MKPVRRPRHLLLAVTTLALSACASKAPSQLTAVATTPLSDLNIVRAEIPAVLVQAQQQPYALPAEPGCERLSSQIAKLDDVLGADLDAPASASNPGLIERGEEAVENHAVGALQRTAEGLVPFRSWVRKLSGAERYSKRVAAAIAAGTVRRAFLKGFSASRGCMAAPQITAEAAKSP